VRIAVAALRVGQIENGTALSITDDGHGNGIIIEPIGTCLRVASSAMMHVDCCASRHIG
jgi:hypothetical protein